MTQKKWNLRWPRRAPHARQVVPAAGDGVGGAGGEGVGGAGEVVVARVVAHHVPAADHSVEVRAVAHNVGVANNNVGAAERWRGEGRREEAQR